MVNQTKPCGDSVPTGETGKGSEKLPFLPKEFYLELLDLPSCKTTGKCDGCGKCG